MSQLIDLEPIMRELGFIETTMSIYDKRLRLIRDADNPKHYLLIAIANADTGAVTSLSACWRFTDGNAMGRRSFAVPLLPDPDAMHKSARAAWTMLRRTVCALSN